MIYVLYHSPCQDGFGAAWAAWKKFGDKAQYLPVSYGKPLPFLPDAEEVYILDFSYPKSVLEELAKRCRVKVLDHHKTAQDDLKGLSFAEFDMQRSGAGMSWDFFHPHLPRPWLIDYVEDRDLWKHQLPHTQEISLALSAHEFKFEEWNSLEFTQALDQGKVLMKYLNSLLQETVRHTQIVSFLEFSNVAVVNASVLTSDLGEALHQKFPDAPFVAIYFDTKEGKRKWSLRSKDHKQDVAAIASRFGGGGHRNSAGFIENTPGEHIKL